MDSLNASRSPHALPSPLPTERGPEHQAGSRTLPRRGLIQRQQKQREGKGKGMGGGSGVKVRAQSQSHPTTCPLGASTTHGSVVVTSTWLWLSSMPSGFLEVFEKPNRGSFTFTDFAEGEMAKATPQGAHPHQTQADTSAGE